jgi:hypothetical protein
VRNLPRVRESLTKTQAANPLKVSTPHSHCGIAPPVAALGITIGRDGHGLRSVGCGKQDLRRAPEPSVSLDDRFLTGISMPVLKWKLMEKAL